MLKSTGMNLSGTPLMEVSFFKKVEKGAGSLIEKIELPYDAESLNANVSANLLDVDIIGGLSGESYYQGLKSSDLRVTFLLNDTLIETPADLAKTASSSSSVDGVITKLLKYCSLVQSETHKPAFVTLVPLNQPLVGGPSGGFGGMLNHMKVVNELVDDSGSRLKARIECCFKEVLSPKEAAKKAGMASPDMTHVFQNKAGDKLVAQATEIYGSPQFSHKVAAANGLASIRRLNVGEYITYPPVER